jgi:hypothetical protein
MTLDEDSGAIKTNNPTHNAPPTIAAAPSTVAMELLPVNAEDVGPPVDGIWDHDNVHDQRFCFDHGENEWLLGTPNRWMRPSDFKVAGAEAKLEAKLQDYNRKPWVFRARSRASHAECNGSLWSHIDVPIKKGKLGNENIYLMRWKACWTPESNIGDMQWVLASYAANNKRLDCRRSTRIGSTAPDRVAKNLAIMVVVGLE